MSDPTTETAAVDERPPWAWILDEFDRRFAALTKVGGSRNPGYSQTDVHALFTDMREAIVDNARGLVAHKHGKERLTVEYNRLCRQFSELLAENKALKERLDGAPDDGPPALARKAIMDGQRFAEATIDLANDAGEDIPDTIGSLEDVVALAAGLSPAAIQAVEERVVVAETTLEVMRGRLASRCEKRSKLAEVLTLATAALGVDDVIDVTEVDERAEVAS